MRPNRRTGFVLRSSDLLDDVLVPHFYDPRISERLAELAATHDLVSIADLISRGWLEMRQGKYISKMHYGTGIYPYVRTSDIANWEIRSDPKHGMGEEVFQHYRRQLDVRDGDVLLVHEGTYLIGAVALITKYDTAILYQHHLAKLRLTQLAGLSPPLLIALLSAPVVQLQIRAKQLTADVIDSIVGRLPDVVLPIPKNEDWLGKLAQNAGSFLERRALARLRLVELFNRLDDLLGSKDRSDIDALRDMIPGDSSAHVSFLGNRRSAVSFRTQGSDIIHDVLVPRYYDPTIDEDLDELAVACDLVTIGELMSRGDVSLGTGDEVGKLAYGGGSVPFVRTSDLGSWELKTDPKQTVSEETYAGLAGKQSVKSGDILVVRDGTYLVGTSAMVWDADVPLLISGGILRVRVNETPTVNPFLLFALLNSGVVKRQMRAKQFTRDVIDTLGRRFEEVVLPLPRSADVRSALSALVRDLLSERAELRESTSQLGEQVEGHFEGRRGAARPSR